MFAVGHCDAADFNSSAKKKSWLRLIHYETDWTGLGKAKSAIHSPEFFLSPLGRINPEEELRASLSSMLENVSTDPNAHAKCRFPARRIWLAQNFPEHRESLQEIDCPNFSAWAPLNKINSVSLVFANGYLGNPASYYGHLFLKFNGADNTTSSYLIDQTLNFGAIGTNMDDPVRYILKGVLGGYEGGFTPADFYFHNANYTERELRDLWEYRLNLDVNEVRYIVSHAWEVIGKRYTYYFFRANCAYRVSELIEIVDGINIIPKNRSWTIPQAVLQTMHTVRHNGIPLIDNKISHPSRQTRLYQRYRVLDQKQRKIITNLVSKQTRLNDQQLQSLSLPERQAILDTLLDYYQFTQDRKETFAVSMSDDYVAALSERLSLPTDDSTKQFSIEEVAPEAGKAPSWAQIGLVHQQGAGLGQTLRIRPALYDQLDVSVSQAKHGSLSMGDLMIEHIDRRLRIMHFDLVAIDSMNPAVTGLPGDRSDGWRLRFGLEQERMGCRDCLVTRLQGDYSLGSTIGIFDTLAAAHAGGALQANSKYDGSGFMRLGASIMTRPTNQFRLRITHEWRRPLESGFDDSRVTSAEARILLSADTDLRVKLDHDFVSRLSLAIGRYW